MKRKRKFKEITIRKTENYKITNYKNTSVFKGYVRSSLFGFPIWECLHYVYSKNPILSVPYLFVSAGQAEAAVTEVLKRP